MAEFIRAYSVVYGSLTIGGTNTALKLDGPVMVREEGDSATVSCTAVYRVESADTDAAFETGLEAINAAMRIPRLRLTINSGSTTPHDWNPASGTKTSGNCKPAYTEPGARIEDSRRSRRLNFSWNLDLNATPYSQDGRRDSTTTAAFAGTDQATLTISGEYRADATYESARSRYDASIAAFVTLVLTHSDFSGRTFELIGTPAVTTDDTDFICHFSRTYLEILRQQALGVTNHASIVNPQLTVTQKFDHPGDSPGKNVSRLVTLAAQYSCEVPKTVSDLNGLWRDTIVPLILATVESVFGTSIAAVTDQTVNPNYYMNTISGSFNMLATSGGNILSYTTSWTTTDDPGEVEENIGTGGPYDRFVYDGPASYTLQITETTRTLGSSTAKSAKKSSKPPSAGGSGLGVQFRSGGDDSGSAGSKSAAGRELDEPSQAKKAGGGAGAGPGAGEWSRPIVTTTTQPTTIGGAPYQISVLDTTRVTVQRWRNPYAAAGGVELTSGGKLKGTEGGY